MLFILVHGTFASRAEWIGNNSLIRKSLEAHYGEKANFVRFRWSGENRHEARMRAGLKLHKKIRRLSKKYIDERIYLIAHSHGGNVALYALDNDSQNSNVSGIITMGTPFLHVDRSDIKMPATIFIALIGIASVFIIVIVSAFLVVGLLMLVGTILGMNMATDSSGMPGLQVLVFVLTWFPFLWWCLIINGKILEKVQDRIIKKLSDKQRVSYSKVGLNRMNFARILRINVVGDEAELLLKLFDRMSRIPYLLWKITKCISFVFFGWIALILAGGAISRVALNVFRHTTIIPHETKVTLAYWLLLVPLMSFVPLALLMLALHYLLMTLPGAVRWLAFGRDSLSEGWLIQVRPHINPPIANFEGKTFKVKRSLFPVVWKHSRMYEDKRVVDEITGWVDRLEVTD